MKTKNNIFRSAYLQFLIFRHSGKATIQHSQCTGGADYRGYLDGAYLAGPLKMFYTDLSAVNIK